MVEMSGMKLMYYFQMAFYNILWPCFVYSKETYKGVVGTEGEKSTKKEKGFIIVYMIFWLVAPAGVHMPTLPNLINGVHQDRVGIVKEYKYVTDHGRINCPIYNVSFTDIESQEEYRYDVYSDTMKKGAKIEVQEFAIGIYEFPTIVVRIDGKETEYYKTSYKNSWGDPVFDKIILIIFGILYVCVHLVLCYAKKKSSMTKKERVFWKTWNWGTVMFVLWLCVCIRKPISGVLEAYIYGFILWGTYAINAVGGVGYVLLAEGFEWKDPVVEVITVEEKCKKYVAEFLEETKKPEEEEEAEEEKLELELSMTTVKLNQMTYSNAEKYYVYKRKYLKKDLFAGLRTASGFFLLIAGAVFTYSKSFLRWIILGILVPVMVIIIYSLVQYFIENRKLLKEASKGSYEYAKVITEFKQPTKFVCSDGHKVKWTMEEGDMKKENGQDAMVVYLKSVNQMYLESVKTFNEIYGESFVEETQVLIQEEVAVNQVYEEVLSDEITTVQLNQMTYDNAEKYYVYKSKYLKKDLFTGVISVNIFYLMIVYIVFELLGSFSRWIILGVLTLVMVIFVYFAVQYFIEQRKLLNEASKGSYEYARFITEFKQPTKFICSDGHEVKWTMEEGDMEKKNGQDAVVVYLKSVDKMYLESVKTFNKIYGETM